jgi:hypothetical protein
VTVSRTQDRVLRTTGDCQQNTKQGAGGQQVTVSRTRNRVLRATGDCQQNTKQGAGGQQVTVSRTRNRVLRTTGDSLLVDGEMPLPLYDRKLISICTASTAGA